MQSRKKLAEDLLDRYLSGNCTEQERNLIERAYSKHTLHNKFELGDLDLSRIANESWHYIAEQRSKPKTIRIAVWPKIAVAASLVLGIGLATYFYQSNDTATLSPQTEEISVKQIVPGGNKATLTLPDGRIIDLAADKSGIMISANSISYADGSHVAQEEGKSNDEPQNMTLSTPRGGQYQVLLSDGTKVWLNAESTLKYPNQFTNDQRTIELTGEAYFEVSQDKKRPFVVRVGNEKIEVLGTHFNAMYYPEESVFKTTLFEGSVKVSNASRARVLTPGQQLQVVDGMMRLSPNVDLEEAIAWKNGYFKFDENLESILTKLSRWYDFEIVYKSKPDATMTFTGKISRNRDIKEILEILEPSVNVHFKIEGRSVTVMK